MSASRPHRKSPVIVLKEGQFLRLLSRDGWEFVTRKNCTGVVIILALTKTGKVLLIEQHRLPVGKTVIEFPAGLVNDCEPTAKRRDHPRRKESFITAAHRELEEETGYRAKKIVKVTQGPASGGSSADSITIVRAYGLTKVGKGGGIESEAITVYEVSLSQVDRWLEQKRKSGVLVDPKIYAGLYFLKKYNS